MHSRTDPTRKRQVVKSLFESECPDADRSFERWVFEGVRFTGEWSFRKSCQTMRMGNQSKTMNFCRKNHEARRRNVSPIPSNSILKLIHDTLRNILDVHACCWNVRKNVRLNFPHTQCQSQQSDFHFQFRRIFVDFVGFGLRYFFYRRRAMSTIVLIINVLEFCTVADRMMVVAGVWWVFLVAGTLNEPRSEANESNEREKINKIITNEDNSMRKHRPSFLNLPIFIIVGETYVQQRPTKTQRLNKMC